jgi:predicted lipoprotein with Yx(FWY)xxD motif
VRRTSWTWPEGRPAKALAPRQRSGTLAIVCLLSALALSACGGAIASSSSGGTEVRSATLAGLGRVLVDRAGYTLYAYMPDHKGRPHCSGSCARQWPPLVLPASQRNALAGPGVHSSLVGAVRRADGRRQVTYDGWPLYTTAHTVPGQANGQASTMGLWYAVSVSGYVDRAIARKTGA